MQLMRPRSGTSFYESFSDLIFCALVLFVALVMVLAANVGVQVDSLQDAEVRLAASQSEVEASRQQLQGIVNTHRYTGASSQPTLNLAVDTRSNTPKIYFVPIEFSNRFNTSIINETPEQAIERQRGALLQVTKCIERQRGYSLEQFSQIVKSFSYYSWGRGEVPYLGAIISEREQALFVDRAFPFSSLAGIQPGSKLISINGVNINQFASISEMLTKTPPDQKTVRLRIDENGRVADYDTRLIYDQIGNLIFTTNDWFHPIASGWRLAEQGLELVPPSGGLAGLLNQEMKPFDQICFDGNQVIYSLADLDFGTVDIQEPVATLRLGFAKGDSRQRVLLGTLPMHLKDAVLMLQSIANGNVAIQFVDDSGQPLTAIPSWVETALLNPSGFVNRTPDLIGLKKWLEEAAERSKQNDEPEHNDDDSSIEGT